MCYDWNMGLRVWVVCIYYVEKLNNECKYDVNSVFYGNLWSLDS